MATKIAIFAAGLNPMGNHQLACLEAVANQFDHVILFPSGPHRTDGIKANIDFVPSRHRATMIYLAHLELSDAAMDKTDLDLSDLERPAFTPTFKIEELIRQRYPDYFVGEDTECWHVIGADWFGRDSQGRLKIHTWQHGAELWQNLNFAILTRPGYSIAEADLPPHRQIIPVSITGSSSDIRRLVPELQPIDQLVPASVADYIHRFGLYSGRPIPAVTKFRTDRPRILLLFDPEKPNASNIARSLFDSLGSLVVNGSDEPYNLIVGVGGDGFQLGLVNAYWERRVPFLGINDGRRGFLMNNVEPALLTPEFFRREFDLYEAPLLEVTVTNRLGDTATVLALNDTVMKSISSQQGWFELSVNGQQLTQSLPADAVLVTTPTGSTAYWRNIGGPAFTVESRHLGIGAVAPDRDYNVHPIMVSDGSVVTIKNVGDPAKRPTIVCADSKVFQDAVSMTARMSPIAHCQILSLPGQREQKVMRLQAPAGYIPV